MKDKPFDYSALDLRKSLVVDFIYNVEQIEVSIINIFITIDND
jgi:hypothetical protein